MAKDRVGPLPTLVFFDNTCANSSAAIRVSITKSVDFDPNPYCDRLREQSSGDEAIQGITAVASLSVTVVTVLGMLILTACCSCWCCCARSGACASNCSRSCHRGCSSCVSNCGCGWIMDNAGGLTFYRTSQNNPLLLWAFAAACLTTFEVVNLPDFRRDDTLNPELQDTVGHWGAERLEHVPLVLFVTSMWRAVVYAVTVFGAIPLVFSDPLRDRSFRSKAIVAGVLIIATNIVAIMLLTDLGRYYRLWPHKAPQIALQVGVGVTHLMTTATYVHLVHTSRVQRRSRRARLQLDASAAAAASGAPADVASSAAAAAAAPPIPYAAVAAPPFDPTMPALHLPDEPADGGDVAGRTPRDSARPVRGWVATGGPGPVGEAAESKAARAPDYGDRGTDRVDAVPGEESISATPGAAGVRAGPPLRPRPVGGSNGQLPFVSESNSELASDLEGGDELGSALPATAEELEERMLEAKRLRSWAGAAGHLLWKVWDGVREEPRVGFRYSAFILASLLVAAVTTTSSFLRALSFVRDLSECSLADSECLYQVQRWFYRRLVAGLVKVDIEVLEVEAAGLCRLLDTGNVEDLIESRWSTNLATAEVLERCQVARQLQGVQQAERRHPPWLAQAETPVLLGGSGAVALAYCISMYTIYHVARAYKKLELKLRAARLAELLWDWRAGGPLAAASSDVASSSAAAAAAEGPAPSSTASGGGGGNGIGAGATPRVPSRSAGVSSDSSTGKPRSHATVRKARVQLGRDILKDYETVSIGQSAYFTATLVSTCFFQLWLGALVLGAIFVPALHPEFWAFVHDNIGWPLSIAVIIGWHIVSQIFLNRYVTDGKRIKRPFVWLFAYVALSSAYCVVSVLLGLMRLVQLVLTSILALSRLDSCLFTVLRGRDRGYASFLAMALMLHSFQQCLKETADRERRAGPLNAPSAASVSAAPSAARNRWQVAVAQAVAIERAPST